MLLIAANACNNEANSCKCLQLPADACRMKYLQNEIPAECLQIEKPAECLQNEIPAKAFKCITLIKASKHEKTE